MAWACMNRQFEIADFLPEHGVSINTDWSTHEPASILHECAVHANYEAAQFLIDRGIDVTIHDYRWNAAAQGWARHAANDTNMADFLARAERARKAQPL
ncbi:MAG: ankyrin repeat domain-containing protein [Bryobacteraceae bacterium]